MHQPRPQLVGVAAGQHAGGEVSQQRPQHVADADDEQTDDEARRICQRRVEPDAQLVDAQQAHGEDDGHHQHCAVGEEPAGALEQGREQGLLARAVAGHQPVGHHQHLPHRGLGQLAEHEAQHQYHHRGELGIRLDQFVQHGPAT
jgi:hypothetical protein